MLTGELLLCHHQKLIFTEMFLIPATKFARLFYKCKAFLFKKSVLQALPLLLPEQPEALCEACPEAC